MRILLSLLLLFTLSFKGVAQSRESDEKLLYKECSEGNFFAEIYYPDGQKEGEMRPLIIFFFGGGWAGGSPSQFYSYCDHFSSQGFVTITGDYRVSSKHHTSPFEAVEDAKSLVRWARKNAGELGIDPNKIVVAGGSAGGHLALCTDLIEGCESPKEDLSVSSRPNYVVGFNPVSDTSPEGYGYEKVKPRVTDISPVHNVKPHSAPMLLFHGTQDYTVPYQNAIALDKKMKEEGNRSTLVSYWGSNHGFFNDSIFKKDNTNHRYSDILYHISLFLEGEGFDIDPSSIEREEICVALIGDFHKSSAKQLESLVGDNYRFEIFSEGGSEALKGFAADIVITTPSIAADRYRSLLEALSSYGARPDCLLLHDSSQSVKQIVKEVKEMKIKINSIVVDDFSCSSKGSSKQIYRAVANDNLN